MVWRCFPFQRLLVRAQRDRRAAEVGDRFAVHELAVDVDPLRDVELAVLVGHAIRARLEILQILGREPVAQIALRVVLRALIVEAVRHLVADDRADAAVVVGVVRVRIEERRLQDAGREGDVVLRRVVAGVDRRRREDAPLVRIVGLADALDVVVIRPRARRLDVRRVRRAADRRARSSRATCRDSRCGAGTRSASSSAAAFVSGPIHDSVGMSSRSAPTRLSMSAFIFAFASGVKLRRTYSCPSSWPMLASAARTQRFQRSCCSFVPGERSCRRN